MIIGIPPNSKPSGVYYVSAIATDNTGGTHTGDSVETTLSSLTIPAGKVQAGILVQANASLSLTGAHSGNITNTIKIYAGPAGSETLRATRTLGIGSAQLMVADITAGVYVTGLTWANAQSVLIKGQLDADSVLANGTIAVNSAWALGF